MENGPVRVLIVSTTMDRGGAETLIMNIFRALDRTKVMFDFILHCDHRSSYEDEIESLGGRIFRLPLFRVYNERSYRRAFRDFFKSHPEYRIIHSHINNSASVFLDEANKCGLHTIVHSHCTSNGTGPRAWIRDHYRKNLYRIAEYRLACSTEAGEWLFEGKAPFKVIKNGINTSGFAFDAAERNAVRKELGVKEGTAIIGNVGRFMTQKNQSFLLDIFNEYRKIRPDSRLLLIGEGPLQGVLEAKIKSLSLEDSVIMPGVRSDMDRVYCAMDVFLLPSLYEGLPVTLVEAQCSGLPCVITDNITDEVVFSDRIIKKALTDSPASWAQSVEKALSGGRYEGSALVRDNGFDIEKTAGELQDFYLELSKA